MKNITIKEEDATLLALMLNKAILHQCELIMECHIDGSARLEEFKRIKDEIERQL